MELIFLFKIPKSCLTEDAKRKYGVTSPAVYLCRHICGWLTLEVVFGSQRPEVSTPIGWPQNPKTHRGPCGQHLQTPGAIVEPGSLGATWIPAGHLNSSQVSEFRDLEEFNPGDLGTPGAIVSWGAGLIYHRMVCVPSQGFYLFFK